ncbi:VF530 family protein [Psychromonas ossibalaenae]|uniref:VF530 family protein n=1 Tax=Psychromonas ossibalaenae TaxID=444922 RepID=UPI0003606243|nr:VF530 family protein [Psychromonas ossibalaenae]
MTDKKNNNPLYGLKLDVLLTEISEHYGWELLSESLEINRFQFHTGMKSTVKFLRNNEWAKEKVENFYLYQYKNFPTPDDKQLSIAPRNRFISEDQQAGEPMEITGDVVLQIDRASRLRTYKTTDNGPQTTKESTRSTEEPPYDPSNPWNK